MQNKRLHDLIQRAATTSPDAVALLYRDRQVSYLQLQQQVDTLVQQITQLALPAHSRIAIYLPKLVGTVAAMFAASAAGCVFVPINPLLKPAQVKHILDHSQASLLITSDQRSGALKDSLPDCEHLQYIGVLEDLPAKCKLKIQAVGSQCSRLPSPGELAAILYTSGSTGLPKGVMLSHENLLLGAESVIQYLEISDRDRLLAVLPFSFDYGLNQLISSCQAGASLVLMDYLLPRDVIRAISRYQVTGLAAIPTLWKQLATLTWDETSQEALRYFTSSGGVMPVSTTNSLREKLPHTAIYLMYGLTEAFRSTYLPPDQVVQRADSIGVAIPHAELQLINPAGVPCENGEAGELVHCGPLVSLGYWNDMEKTRKRFRVLPGTDKLGVWSGDLLRQDEQGYYYFVARMDAMIKTSGYRVSPGEVESVAHAARPHTHLAAVGVAHPTLGQAIMLVVEKTGEAIDPEIFMHACKQQLPQYMVPLAVEYLQHLPHNSNGKIDRVALARQFQDYFTG